MAAAAYQRPQLSHFSPLQLARLHYNPPTPQVLRPLASGRQPKVDLAVGQRTTAEHPAIEKLFPHTYGQATVDLLPGKTFELGAPLKVGLVLSGGQAAGGHNVISGMFDFLQARNPANTLIGFLGGPIGVVNGDFIPLTEDLISHYRNQGGFDIIGTGRDKIETPAQLAASRAVCERLGLDGLVVIGGDDSNTNAAVLAEYFRSEKSKTCVIGVPKTIDGDLKTPLVELSFGFDTACKIYANLIGNIQTDALSAKKYYHFIRLMGRSASHITLECALQTHPNITLIGEEVAARQLTLVQLTNEIADSIVRRAQLGKNYGSVLVPEGLIEFVPEMNILIGELNELLAKDIDHDVVRSKLTPQSRALFDFLPKQIREELMLDRDPHGNVQVSRIETEKLLVHLVSQELQRRKASGAFKGKFQALTHFFGYEGRCGLPSNFDANYCYALGKTAAALIEHQLTGYIACVRNVSAPPSQWRPAGVPLTSMMNVERRKGKDKPVIRKALVDLAARPYLALQSHRDKWRDTDAYQNPGPIQYFGISAEQRNVTLDLEHSTDKVPLRAHL